MSITLRFKDKDVSHSNPKAARAWLRKNGMNVRQATKDGEVWHFDFDLSENVKYTTRPKPQKIKPKTQTVIPKLKPQPIDQSPTQEIKNLPVLGTDLQPGDVLVNFAPGHDLTLNYEGIHEIVIPAQNITRRENRFMGFYSQESGGLSSYPVDFGTTYDVVRRE